MKRAVGIESIAVALPQRLVGNDDYPYTQLSELPQNWWRFWGIKSRPLLDRSQNESVQSLAIDACRKALAAAQREAAEVDLLLCNISSPLISSSPSGGRMFPRLSAELCLGLGAGGLHGWDVEMECATFLLLVQIAANFLRAGRYRRVLICSCESMSSILDPTSKDSSTFGDAAAAAILSCDGTGELLASSYFSNAEHYNVATVRWREPENPTPAASDYSLYFTLRGGTEELMKFIPSTVPRVIHEVLRTTGVKQEQIKQFILHQPGKVLLDHWANRIGADAGSIAGRYPVTLGRYGCLVSVSIPLTLCLAVQRGLVESGDYVILGGAGTGWGYGAQLWRWGSTRATGLDATHD